MAKPASRSRGTTMGVALAGACAALAYGLVGPKMGLGAPLVMMALGGFALGLCGVALFRVVDPLFRGDADGTPEAAQPPVRKRELEREKHLVLKAIREIEHDHQMRKISDEDHQAQTARYRARAMRLLREIDAEDDHRSLIEQELKTRLSLLEARRVRCGACTTANDPDAKFCKTCGKPVGSQSATAEKTS